jgi:serine/threonine protein kinase/tetratricopeptide (TPR) repeat protein
MPTAMDDFGEDLPPEIKLEGRIARGGMGEVFLGWNTVLEHPVAVKFLLLEHARAVTVERFLREARHVAKLRHENIVRVYHADMGRTRPYYVMEYVPGGTLAERLERGPLPAHEVVTLGRALLAALGHVHSRKLIHRDVKPSNIFLDGDRVLLSDFGVAFDQDSTESALTQPGEIVGTLAYMSPEQRGDGEIDARSDVYSAGLVLFEACTGRRWWPLVDPNDGDWTGVPPTLQPVLARAIQLKRERRWPDAKSFASALGVTESRRRWPWAAALAGIVAGVLLWRYWHLGPPPASDLAIFPFETKAVDQASGLQVTKNARWYFERLPGLALASSSASSREWDASPLGSGQDRLVQLTHQLQSRYGLWGVVSPKGAQLEVQLQVVNGSGRKILDESVRADSGDYDGLADSIALRVVEKVFSKSDPLYRQGGSLAGVNPLAIPEFFYGEDGFKRDAFKTAEVHYTNALAIDSTFVLAAWRLANVRRWMPTRTDRPFAPGFLALYQSHRDAVPLEDRKLIEAQFAPSGAARFALYDEAIRESPQDAYAALLYGDEVFHRGPLSGLSLDSAVTLLRRSVELDPLFAPAWEHLAWALIRLGRRREATGALDTLWHVSGRPEESEIFLPLFLSLASRFRFEPGAPPVDDPLLRSPKALALAARGGLAFDLPDAEVALGLVLVSARDVLPGDRASGEIAQGVGLIGSGRPNEALHHFDSAAALFPHSDEARLQAAEWRLMLEPLGVLGVTDSEVARGRRDLVTLAGTPGAATRASWALAFDALARGDTVTAVPWMDRVRNASDGGGPMNNLLSGMLEAARGNPKQALALSEPALAFDSAGRPDPFLRAALHLERGRWLDTMGLADAADRAWLWYENTDVVGWPSAEVQAGEVDWALASYARLRRARLAHAQGKQTVACALLTRSRDIWSKAEPAIADLAHRASAQVGKCPS